MKRCCGGTADSHRPSKKSKTSTRLNRRKPIMSKQMFRILMASVQPDKGGTNAAAAEFNSNRKAIEAALCGSEAERRRWELPSASGLPRTWAEMEAAPAKVRAENSARGKRAAATRAARKVPRRPAAVRGRARWRAACARQSDHSS